MTTYHITLYDGSSFFASNNLSPDMFIDIWHRRRAVDGTLTFKPGGKGKTRSVNARYIVQIEEVEPQVVDVTAVLVPPAPEGAS